MTNYELMLTVNYRLAYPEDTVANRKIFISQTVFKFLGFHHARTHWKLGTKALEICHMLNMRSLTTAVKTGFFGEDFSTLSLMLQTPFFKERLAEVELADIEKIQWKVDDILLPTEGLLWQGQVVPEMRVDRGTWIKVMDSVINFAKVDTEAGKEAKVGYL